MDPTPPADLAIETSAPEQTQAIAAALAGCIRPGDVLVLAGDLGAGKTTFTKGFGAALGVTDPITSPTFTLAREYIGRLPLHHLDVYRLEQLDEVLDLALPELLESGGVVVIEWGDTILPALPKDYLDLRIGFGDGDDDRVMAFRFVGANWASRRTEVTAAITGPLDNGQGAASC